MVTGLRPGCCAMRGWVGGNPQEGSKEGKNKKIWGIFMHQSYYDWLFSNL